MAEITGGSIIWNLDVDDSKLKSGLNKASSNVDDASKSIEKSTTNAKDSVNKLSKSFSNAEDASKAFTKTIAIAGTAIIAAAGFSIKSASEMENLRISLDVMTGSAESGGKVFKDLYDFAAKTPFETSNLAKATQTMLGFGISSKDVMGNLKMLGDISLGNNDKLQSLTLAFSQMSSTGRLMGQDLLQMINAGFNPLTIIAQKTGKSMLELKSDMEKGLITTDMVTDAFKTATSEGGLFYQGMDKGAQTLSGSWSTLMDSVGMLARQLVGISSTNEVLKGGLFDKLKDGIKGVTDALAYLSTDEGMKRIEDFMNTMKIVVPIVAGAIIGSLVPAFIAWTAAAWAALVPLIPFIAIGAAIAAGIVLLVIGIKAALPFFKEFANWVVNAFNGVITYFRELPGKIQGGLSSLGSNIRNSFSNSWSSLVGEISQWPNRIWDWGRNIADSFVNGFKNALNGIGEAFKRTMENAKRFLQGNSPPKEGPLKNIDKWGFNIGNAWVDGFAGSVGTLSSMMTSSLSQLQGVMGYGDINMGEGGSQGSTNTQNITIQSVNVQDQSDIDALTRSLGFKLSTI